MVVGQLLRMIHGSFFLGVGITIQPTKRARESLHRLFVTRIFLKPFFKSPVS